MHVRWVSAILVLTLALACKRGSALTGSFSGLADLQGDTARFSVNMVSVRDVAGRVLGVRVFRLRGGRPAPGSHLLGRSDSLGLAAYITTSYMHLFTFGNTFVKMRLTLPEAVWRESTAPNFAPNLARSLATRPQ